jgi:hypothetical protein
MFRELVARMVAKCGTISPLLTENSELDELLFSLRGRKYLCAECSGCRFVYDLLARKPR